MSGWALGLVLAVVLVVGWVAGIVSTYLYGRRLLKRRLNELSSQDGLTITGSSSGGDLRISGHVEPPPPRGPGREEWP